MLLEDDAKMALSTIMDMEIVHCIHITKMKLKLSPYAIIPTWTSLIVKWHQYVSHTKNIGT
jgi:hypothetical protein